MRYASRRNKASRLKLPRAQVTLSKEMTFYCAPLYNINLKAVPLVIILYLFLRYRIFRINVFSFLVADLILMQIFHKSQVSHTHIKLYHHRPGCIIDGISDRNVRPNMARLHRGPVSTFGVSCKFCYGLKGVSCFFHFLLVSNLWERDNWIIGRGKFLFDVSMGKSCEGR